MICTSSVLSLSNSCNWPSLPRLVCSCSAIRFGRFPNGWNPHRHIKVLGVIVGDKAWRSICRNTSSVFVLISCWYVLELMVSRSRKKVSIDSRYPSWKTGWSCWKTAWVSLRADSINCTMVSIRTIDQTWLFFALRTHYLIPVLGEAMFHREKSNEVPNVDRVRGR